MSISGSLFAIAMTALSFGRPSESSQALGATLPSPPVLESMVGEWSVVQRMWTGPEAEPQQLPPAVARRTLAVGGGFVEEVMTLADNDPDNAFTRTAHINYNAVDGVFEYHSIDSRAPQQMHYQTAAASPDDLGPFLFGGGVFVAAQWGDQKNIAFRYRVELSAVEDNRQELWLYLRPLTAERPQEFRAFHYVYTRK